MSKSTWNSKEKMQKKLTDMIPIERLIHYVNTPLSAMYVNIQMLEQNQNLDASSLALTRNIHKSWLRIIKMIHDACDTAKIYQGNFEPKFRNKDIVFILQNIVEQTHALMWRDIDIFFISDIQEKIVALDQEILERILLNIMGVALKYTDENGQIVVSLADKGDMISIHVRHYGKQLSKDILEQIQSSAQDFSNDVMGLFIAKQFTLFLNGIFQVENAAQGNNFSFDLPCFTVEESHQQEIPIESFYNNNIINIELSDEF